MYVNILQKNKKDVTALLLFGIVAVSFGFGVYYLLPLGLVSFNLSLSLSVSLGILFGMIFALALLTVNLMQILNVIVARCVLILESSSIRLTVLKNLVAHRDRNRMTALVFSLTLGFILFLNIVARIPFNVDWLNCTRTKGFHSMRIGRMNIPMPEIELFIREYEDHFEEFGAVTAPMFNMNGDIYWSERMDWTYPKDIETIKISDLGRRKWDQVSLIGASPNFIDSIERQFIVPETYDWRITRFPEQGLAGKAPIHYLYDKGGLTFGE